MQHVSVLVNTYEIAQATQGTKLHKTQTLCTGTKVLHYHILYRIEFKTSPKHYIHAITIYVWIWICLYLQIRINTVVAKIQVYPSMMIFYLKMMRSKGKRCSQPQQVYKTTENQLIHSNRKGWIAPWKISANSWQNKLCSRMSDFCSTLQWRDTAKQTKKP